MNNMLIMLLDKIIEDLELNCVCYSAIGKVDIIYDLLDIHGEKPFTAGEKLAIILSKLEISWKDNDND